MYRLGIRGLPKIESSGAAGSNIGFEQGRGILRISQQRLGEQFVVRGLVADDGSAIGDGLRTFAWILPHQNATGEFATNHHGVHGVVFTTSAILYAEALLAVAGMRERGAEREVLIASAVHAAQWLAGVGWDRFWKSEAVYAHQSWLLAYTLEIAAGQRESPLLASAAKLSVSRSLATQSDEGWYAEFDGPDTNYSSASTLWAQRLWIATGNPILAESIDLAVAWIAGCIVSDGRIDGSQNSRCGPGGRDVRNGRILGKGLGYRNFAKVLVAWSVIRKRPDLEALAVFCWNARPRRSA